MNEKWDMSKMSLIIKKEGKWRKMASHSLGITDSMIYYFVLWRNAQRDLRIQRENKTKPGDKKQAACVENPEKHKAKNIRQMKKHASSNKRNRISMTKNFSLVL